LRSCEKRRGPTSAGVVGDREARTLLVHDNATSRDLIRDLGVPAEARIVPPQPVRPLLDELAGVAAAHDLTPMGPPMSVEDSDAILGTAR
jgi:hypothetical protein